MTRAEVGCAPGLALLIPRERKPSVPAVTCAALGSRIRGHWAEGGHRGPRALLLPGERGSSVPPRLLGNI